MSEATAPRHAQSGQAAIGFIGLGQMGAALARRVLRAFPLSVFDLDAGKCADLAALGAIVVKAPAEIAAACGTIVTCLPTSELVRDLILGKGGLADQAAPGTLFIDMTTGFPEVTREIATALRERGLWMVDAPVSGGPQGAEAGTIAIMAGGPPEAYAAAEPMLRSISSNVTHVGDVGAGHTLKLLNNFMAAGARLLAFEALALGARNGLDPQTCIGVINKAAGRSYMTEVIIPRHIFSDQLEQHFSVGLMLKDLILAARLVGPEFEGLDLAGTVREIFARGVETLGASADINMLIRLFEKSAGKPIAKTPA